jgi:hypothetical protein
MRKAPMINAGELAGKWFSERVRCRRGRSGTLTRRFARLEGRREQCNQQVAALDWELQTARATVSTQTPAIDPKRLAEGLVYVFGAFEEQPFEFQRDLLREAIREIVVDGRAIPRFTFRGRFLGRVLGERVNLVGRSRSRSQIDTPDDLTITLPEPWVIPSAEASPGRDATGRFLPLG